MSGEGLASLHAGQGGLASQGLPRLEPFPPQIQTPLPASPELWTQAKDRRARVQGDVPSSALCRRSWSPGPRTSAETLEFFNVKPEVHSPSLSFFRSFVPGTLHILSSHREAHYHSGGISARCGLRRLLPDFSVGSLARTKPGCGNQLFNFMAGGCQDSEEKTASDSEGGRRWLWGRAGGRGASAGAGPGVAASWMRTALQPNKCL